MSQYRITPGSSAPRLYFRWWADDGTAKTDGVAADISAAEYLRKSSGVWPASGTSVGSLTDGSKGDDYSAGTVIRDADADGLGNLYSIDPPTAAAADGASAVRLKLTVSSGTADIIASPLEHPVESTADIANSVSAELADDFGVTQDLIESQRDDHARVGIGNIYYVDPNNGDTHANGNRGGRSDPYSTVQDCHDNAVTTGNHDVIILVPSGGAGGTSHDEQFTISKDYVFLRGPGLGYVLTSSSNGDVATISGEGVELSSVEVQTHTAGSGKGVVVTGDFVQVRHVTISRTQGDGITITDCSRTLVENCRLYGTGQSGSGDGIKVDGTGATTQFARIFNSQIYDTQGDAISLQGSGVDDTIVAENTILDSTGYGVNIGSGVTATVLSDNVFANNSSGAYVDNGTRTRVETGNTVVLPAAATVPARGDETSVPLYLGETISTSLTVTDQSGDPVDLSGKTLELAVETLTGTDVTSIPDGSIAISGASSQTATVTWPSAVTESVRTLRMFLRDTANGEVLIDGKIHVDYAAETD